MSSVKRRFVWAGPGRVVEQATPGFVGQIGYLDATSPEYLANLLVLDYPAFGIPAHLLAHRDDWRQKPEDDDHLGGT